MSSRCCFLPPLLIVVLTTASVRAQQPVAELNFNPPSFEYEAAPSASFAPADLSLAPPPDEAWFQRPTETDALPLDQVLGEVRLPDSSVATSAAYEGTSLPGDVTFPRARAFGRSVLADHRNYYTQRTVLLTAFALAAGGAMAQSNIDREFQEFWQGEVAPSHGLRDFRNCGEGTYVLPLYVVAALAGNAFENQPALRTAGEWGERSFRSAAVGAPALLFWQVAIGASRPNEAPYDSRWRPFNDDNGASGHTFMGAIPWLTAAQLTERPLLKAGFVAGSFLPGMARLDENHHYLSQVMIGWSLAWLATSAVNQTETGEASHWVPWADANGVGLGYEWRL
jgi:hypothetical protein